MRCAFAGILVIACLTGCTYKKQMPVGAPAPMRRADQRQVLIRSGSLDLRTQDLDVTKGKIEGIVHDMDGRVQDWSLENGKWLNMTLRVPEKRLDEAMDRVSTLGKVVGRSLRSRDVTEELIDLEARLRNLRALRDRLRSYLEKATNLEEILAVEKELARVQTEIEAMEAKLKVLNEQVAMSELDIRARHARWL
jgi:hypothetical protein